MSHTDIILAELEVLRGVPLPLVVQVEGTCERPGLNEEPPRVEPPKPVKHDVWVTDERTGIISRFPLLSLPATAAQEGVIFARGKFPGRKLRVSVRVAV